MPPFWQALLVCGVLASIPTTIAFFLAKKEMKRVQNMKLRKYQVVSLNQIPKRATVVSYTEDSVHIEVTVPKHYIQDL